jgi:hypothetical protein
MSIQTNIIFDAQDTQHTLPQSFSVPEIFTVQIPGAAQQGQPLNDQGYATTTQRADRSRVSVLLRAMRAYEACGSMFSQDFNHDFSELLLLLSRLTAISNGRAKVNVDPNDAKNAIALLIKVMEIVGDGRLSPQWHVGLR